MFRAQKTSLLIFSLLLFVIPAYAVEFDSIKINADIQGEAVYLNYIVRVSNPKTVCVSDIELNVPLNYELISLKDDYGELDYSLKSDSITPLFNPCISKDSDRLVLLKLKSEGIGSFEGNYYKYVFDFYPDYNINNFEHVVKLPPKASSKDVINVYPKAKEFTNFERFGYVWQLKDVKEPHVFILKYKALHTDYLNISIIVLVAIVSASLIFWIIVKLKQIKSKSKMKGAIEILNEKEKIVVNEVINNEGINQSELRRKVNLTKSNLTKIIAKLELRNVLKRKSYGKINKLYLGEKMKKS